jgi:phage terminase large subunit
MDADEWCDRLIQKLNVYHSMAGKNPLAKIWLPHDARAKTFAAKHSAVEIFIKRFGADKVAITPPSSIPDRINAGRKIIERCAFNETKCAAGIEGLRSWAYEYDEEKKMFGNAPVHDWASHPSDAFTYGCLIMQMTQPKPAKEKAKFFNDQTAFDLFDLHPEHKRARI